MNFNAVKLIAQNEFSTIISNPVVIISSICLVIFIFINAFGYSYLYPQLVSLNVDNCIFQGWCNSCVISAEILSILSLCIGIISISWERSGGSLRVLLTKPVYRKDVIAGKLLGVNAFLLLLNLFAGLVNLALLTALCGEPGSDDYIRMGTGVFSVTVFCFLTTGVMMLFALVFKGLIESLIFASSWLYVAWFLQWPDSWGPLRFVDPWYQWVSVVLSINKPVDTWSDAAFPLLLLLIIETVIVFSASFYIFNKEDV